MPKRIPVEVSARHVHLSQKDLNRLFGDGHVLKFRNKLSQETDFAAHEIVEIEKGGRRLGLRVIGPVRKETQVELSLADVFFLGIKPVLKISGDIQDTPGAFLLGPRGRIKKSSGVIVAARHLHCDPKEAESLGLKNGQMVSIEIKGKRSLIFNNIKVRVNAGYKLAVHLDTDEGNAAGINKNGYGFLNLEN